MTAFFEALEQGYTPEQVLGYISKAIPQMNSMIRKAQKSGYPAQQIIGFLSKNFDTEDRKGMSESERHASNRRADSERTKYGLQLAGTAIATPLVARAAQGAIARALPSSLTGAGGQSPLPNSPISPNGGNPLNTGSAPIQGIIPQGTQQQASSSQSPTNSIAQSLPQSTQPVQAQGIGINAKEILSKYPGFESKVLDMVKSKNTPEAIAQYFKQFNASQTKKLEKEAGQPIEAIIAQYMTESPEAQSNVKPALQPSIPEEKKPLSREEALGKFRDKIIASHDLKVGDKFTTKRGDQATLTQLNDKTFEYKTDNGGIRSGPLSSLDSEVQGNEQESAQIAKNVHKKIDEAFPTQKIEKGSTVSSPQGIGEIQAIRNGKAIIEVDGKKHQVDEDELESSPLPEKDLADLLDDLLKGIESKTGEDVSRMVQWAGYNPENNTLTFLPHTGKLYKYGDISKEDADLLTDILSVRKTSGSNFIGAWKKDSKSPIGAALSKLIRKLQSERGGKGNEYEETHEPIYSAYEPAIEAKKRKKKKK